MYTASFAVNFLSGELVLVDGVVAFQVVDGIVTLLWVSLDLREDGKNVVPFLVGEH